MFQHGTPAAAHTGLSIVSENRVSSGGAVQGQGHLGQGHLGTGLLLIHRWRCYCCCWFAIGRNRRVAHASWGVSCPCATSGEWLVWKMWWNNKAALINKVLIAKLFDLNRSDNKHRANVMWMSLKLTELQRKCCKAYDACNPFPHHLSTSLISTHIPLSLSFHLSLFFDLSIFLSFPLSHEHIIRHKQYTYQPRYTTVLLPWLSFILAYWTAGFIKRMNTLVCFYLWIGRK